MLTATHRDGPQSNLYVICCVGLPCWQSAGLSIRQSVSKQAVPCVKSICGVCVVCKLEQCEVGHGLHRSVWSDVLSVLYVKYFGSEPWRVKLAKGRKHDNISFPNRKIFTFFMFVRNCVQFLVRWKWRLEREREREREISFMSSRKAIISIRYNVYV